MAYTTVSTVGASAAFRSLVDLDVFDNKVAGVETLGVGIGLSILQKTKQLLGGFHRPTRLGNTELFPWKRTGS